MSLVEPKTEMVSAASGVPLSASLTPSSHGNTNGATAPRAPIRKRLTASKAGGVRRKSKKGRTTGSQDKIEKANDEKGKKKIDEEHKETMVEDPGEQRVSIWIREEGRKLSGSSSPKKKHLARYLRKNSKHEVWAGQSKNEAGYLMNRVSVWNIRTQRKVTGAAAPLEKNLAAYLKRHPHIVVYVGQKKQEDVALLETNVAIDVTLVPMLVSNHTKVREVEFEYLDVVAAAFESGSDVPSE